MRRTISREVVPSLLRPLPSFLSVSFPSAASREGDKRSPRGRVVDLRTPHFWDVLRFDENVLLSLQGDHRLLASASARMALTSDFLCFPPPPGPSRAFSDQGGLSAELYKSIADIFPVSTWNCFCAGSPSSRYLRSRERERDLRSIVSTFSRSVASPP